MGEGKPINLNREINSKLPGGKYLRLPAIKIAAATCKACLRRLI
jgi:hypothetical protein